MIQGYLIFHLNLAYSSIEIESRSEVIKKCYWPLLELVESTGIPIGIELSGWTLRELAAIDPAWVRTFRNLLTEGRCELIGSGYGQIIGPLVPYDINHWNQRLGVEEYQRLLAIRPTIALVNEMAYCSSLVEIYQDSGYAGFIMDRDNVRLALGIEDQPISKVPTHAMGNKGEISPVLWSDSILFQKLQHFAHGDITLALYLAYIRQRIENGERLIPIYCNDAEIFDYRPGRFREERPIHTEGEWERLKRALEEIERTIGVRWCSPSVALAATDQTPERRVSSLVSATQPLPVKKQAKYNVSRWAVTGRDNTWINTMCHRLTNHLSGIPVAEQRSADWRSLCELWASDLRTHITERRWRHACNNLGSLAHTLGVALKYGHEEAQPVGTPVQSGEQANIEGFALSRDSENILLSVETKVMRLVLNLRRGLTVHSLSFLSQDFTPVIGTLQHGYFDTIALGADYYSGGVIIEYPEKRRRITDLERVEPEIIEVRDGLQLLVRIPTSFGEIVKTVTAHRRRESISLGYSFPRWQRMRGVIRVGMITLFPEAFTDPITVACVNGGPAAEYFTLDRPCDHSAVSSTLVSCMTGLGATDGTLVIGDRTRRLVIGWDPAQCAVMPMIVHKLAKPNPLTRIIFSLQEIDESARPGGRVGAVVFQVSAA